ncbi:lipopolysaccharide biosynthesis protein [Chloroflexota bacterium]
MSAAKLPSFVKETIDEAARIFTTKEGLKGVYGVSLYRNAVYLMINSAVLASTGVIFWMAATRLYPTEAVGLASASIAAIGLLAHLSTLGLDYGLIRLLPGSGKRARDMINSCFTVGGLTSIVLAFIFFAGLGFWSPALLPIREHPIFFAAFIFLALTHTLQRFTLHIFVTKRRAEFALVQGLTYGLFRFAPLFVMTSFSHTFSIFASLGIAVSVSVAVAIFLLLPKVGKDYRPFPVIKKGVLKEMMRFSSANYVANIFWMLPQLSLPLIVVNLLGAEQNAYFYIAWNVASILYMVPLATSSSLFAEGSHEGNKLEHSIKRSLKLNLVLLVPAMIILLLLGYKVLLFFGQAYSENATKLLWILTASALPLSFNYVYYGIRRVEMRMKSVIGLNAFVTIATLGMSYLLLPRMGILGAGVAWLTTQSLVAVVVLLILNGRRHGSAASMPRGKEPIWR